MATVATSRRFYSLPFVWAALAAGAVPGFGMGAALFAAIALGVPVGTWWAAAAQAHGHSQLFGFAGLMVFGVGFYFLPRLRGAPLVAPHLLPLVLALFGGGLTLRVLGQQVGPLLTSATGSALARAVFATALAVSGPLELAGAAVALAMLARTGTSGPPLRTRAGVMQVLPLMVTAWVGLLLALLLNAAGTVVAGATLTAGVAATAATWLLPIGLDGAAVRLAFLGWLVPLAVAFAARNFPLFLRTPLASARTLAWGLAILIDGLVADAVARIVPSGWESAAAAGAALEGLALLWFTYAVGALGPKVRLPGQHVDPEEAALAAATASPLAGAFLWLAVAGVLLLAEALSVWGWWPPPPEDAQRHALGAGFLTLLIVGMGLRLLPGFAGARPRAVGRRAATAAILLAHAAALLRVVPPLVIWAANAAAVVPDWLSQSAVAAEAAAGAAGVAAIAAFALALRAPLGAAPALQPGSRRTTLTA